jgi:hypothetical protein
MPKHHSNEVTIPSGWEWPVRGKQTKCEERAVKLEDET